MLRTARLGMLVIFGASLLSCGSDAKTVTPASLRREAARMEWPSGVPSTKSLSRFYQLDGAAAPLETILERANACVWYGAWLSDYRSSFEVSRRTLLYLEKVIPGFAYLRNASGGVEQAHQFADSARRGEPDRIVSFLAVNKCQTLDQP